MLALHAARAPASRGVAATHRAHAPARFMGLPLAYKARSRRSVLAPSVARHVAAAALTEQELAKRALRLDTFEPQAVDEARQRCSGAGSLVLTHALAGVGAAAHGARSRRGYV